MGNLLKESQVTAATTITTSPISEMYSRNDTSLNTNNSNDNNNNNKTLNESNDSVNSSEISVHLEKEDLTNVCMWTPKEDDIKSSSLFKFQSLIENKYNMQFSK
jgi:hypothetical protein